jgi:uncharacterized protein (DUF486 family)
MAGRRPAAGNRRFPTPAAGNRCVSTRAKMDKMAFWAPPLLLLGSNVFMTFAWYGHLRFTERPLWLVVPLSWGLALFEYCLAVPANRIGHAVYSTAELKTMQEIITLIVFAVFSILYLREAFTISQGIGFVLIALGAFFVFKSPVG